MARFTQSRWRPARVIQPGRGAAPTFASFTPYKANPYPTGTYDPSIDAQESAAHRGLGDLLQDDQRDTIRDTVDYGLKRDSINLQQSRGDQDFATQRQTLARSYALLGNRQAQSINAAGVGGGGASLQAAAKRAMNESIDAAPIATAQQRLHDDTSLQLGDLGLGYQRTALDRGTTEARAKREDSQYGIDANALRGYQAAAAGYEAPGRGEKGGIPTSEHVGPLGNHTQVRVVNGVTYHVRPDGSVAKVDRGSARQAAEDERRRQAAAHSKALGSARRR